MADFGYVNLAVLVLYFGAMASMGPLFASKSRTTEGYFLGDRSFPGWLIGISMFATSISSISFLAYPADAYKTAYLRFIPNLALPLVVLMASHFFLPFFRRGKITSAYEYLEGRFGPNVRLYAASAYIIGQVIRISMILYLVAQLVEEITGLPPIYAVVIGGVVTSFYTIMGGIRAVLWTDFIQAVVLWIGGLISLWVVLALVGADSGIIAGMKEVINVAVEDGKFAIAELQGDKLVKVPWGFDFTQKTVLLMFLVGIGNWTYEYAGNQNVIQRYCAAKSPRDARQAMWVCCWFSIPTWALFMFLGTALYVFYKAAPTPESIAMIDGTEKAEGILPYFVTSQLPMGLSGLVIAAVLSAAMSSISSSINGVSAVSVVDIWRRRIVTDRDDKHYVFVAKAVGAIQAVIMIVGAIILVSIEMKTLQDTANIISSLTAGGLAGLYLLGFLTTRADGRAVGVAIGLTLLYTGWMALSKIPSFPDALKSNIDTYYAGIIGHTLLFVVAYILAATFMPRREPVPTNYCVQTQDDSPLE
jgi:SSS family solute:Na+ symporter